jgi:hypothetical protein
MGLKCKISLSKKIRSVLKNGGSLVLTADSINSGKGEATLVLKDRLNQDKDIEQLIGEETSIIIKPTKVVEHPLNNSVTSIFSSDQSTDLNSVSSFSGSDSARTAIDRMAATEVPGNHNHSYYSEHEIQTPEQFKVTEEPDFIKHVESYEELISEINKSKNKQSSINVSPIEDKDPPSVAREKAILLEQKEMQESIGRDAYVVNDKCASLTINDIGLDLPLNTPRNIGNISAKKLSQSRELWNLFKSDMIKFVNPDQAGNLLKNADKIERAVIPDLEIYDSFYEAQDNIYQRNQRSTKEIDDVEILDLGVESLGDDSEEMKNLRMSKPSRTLKKRVDVEGNVSTLSGNVRKSFHGSGINGGNQEQAKIGKTKQSKTVGGNSKINKSGIKTISKKF